MEEDLCFLDVLEECDANANAGERHSDKEWPPMVKSERDKCFHAHLFFMACKSPYLNHQDRRLGIPDYRSGAMKEVFAKSVEFVQDNPSFLRIIRRTGGRKDVFTILLKSVDGHLCRAKTNGALGDVVAEIVIHNLRSRDAVYPQNPGYDFLMLWGYDAKYGLSVAVIPEWMVRVYGRKTDNKQWVYAVKRGRWVDWFEYDSSVWLQEFRNRYYRQGLSNKDAQKELEQHVSRMQETANWEMVQSIIRRTNTRLHPDTLGG